MTRFCANGCEPLGSVKGNYELFMESLHYWIVHHENYIIVPAIISLILSPFRGVTIDGVWFGEYIY
jgi:hypothetical protein